MGIALFSVAGKHFCLIAQPTRTHAGVERLAASSTGDRVTAGIEVRRIFHRLFGFSGYRYSAYSKALTAYLLTGEGRRRKGIVSGQSLVREGVGCRGDNDTPG